MGTGDSFSVFCVDLTQKRRNQRKNKRKLHKHSIEDETSIASKYFRNWIQHKFKMNWNANIFPPLFILLRVHFATIVFVSVCVCVRACMHSFSSRLKCKSRLNNQIRYESIRINVYSFSMRWNKVFASI